MLGSLHDADDALQETLLRAWRHLDRFEPRAPFRAWLYRIATNVCLTMLERRARHAEVPWTDLAEAGAGGKEAEPMYLDPYPDRLLDELGPTASGPEATVVRQEGVELAFVAAAQFLPPKQRATLLLRDVIGYSAAEVAGMLETTVAGVNSALQRARATMEREQNAGRVTRLHARTDTATEQMLVRRLTDAWHAADVPGIVSLLTKDAVIAMPPQPDRYVGREAATAFLSDRRHGIAGMRLIATRANHQPTVAAYRCDDDGVYRAYMVLVLSIEGDAIASLTRFRGSDLFVRFGLPPTLGV
jgi:RNA polymerase sigma-70 factor (ECF subfamily)